MSNPTAMRRFRAATRIQLVAAFATLLCAASAFGQNNTRVLSADEILKRITYPPEFEATVFASPPNISYPIFLSAAPDGTLFVGCDQNGSLDQQRNRGRVVMCQDTNRDGRADVFTDFAVMDVPRGVAWDASTRTLYVMHPPKLTAYHDDDNNGVADREEDLITGLGPELSLARRRSYDQRHPPRHRRLDLHCVRRLRRGESDGQGWPLALDERRRHRARASRRHRPGAIVVRACATFSRWRSVPTLDLFTRDNTNDGDDWNVRLSFVPVGAQMGYPSLFRNFADEIIPPMIDFGGGSPVGSIFIDEPALPEGMGARLLFRGMGPQRN